MNLFKLKKSVTTIGMNSVDINYRNQRNILIATVATHSIGKSRLSPYSVAEVITAIALVILLPFMASEFAFLAVGLGMIAYRFKQRPSDEKQIYLLAHTHFKRSRQRELQIYIHPSVVRDKLQRANQRAVEAEKNAPSRGFITTHGYLSDYGHKIRSFSIDSAIVTQSDGRRDYMEDVALGSIFTVNFGNKTLKVDVKAVLDGHNGMPNISNTRLEKIVKGQLERHHTVAFSETAIFNALKFVGLELNECFGNNGSTVILALQIENRIWFLNIGDSRALIIEPEGKVLNMTVDAHPNGSCSGGPLEMSYVGPALTRGGLLDNHHVYSSSGKKNSMLRSLGDHSFPKTARPKITTYEISKKGCFLVLSSDGLFEKGRSFEIGAFIQSQIQKDIRLESIGPKVLTQALSRGVKDNLTCLVKWLNSDITVTNAND